MAAKRGMLLWTLAGVLVGFTAGLRVPPPPTSEAAKTRAVALLGAAGYQREVGELGRALELAGRAQAAWPDYHEARTFRDTLAPQAAATAHALAAS